MDNQAERPERPADPAVRKANLRRIFPLFRSYRPQLAVVFTLIFFSALLGVIPAFLLKDILNTALPENDLRLLTALVAGMISISIVTGAIGVYQTLLSNRVGQAVMHDLRTAVYQHLQRLSLAFFTRTRTGDVQSRIANDIGGIDTVVTSTATSVLSNVTTVIATVVAMLLLDWRLALFALILLPLFVWLTKRVGDQRKKVTAERQISLSDVSSIVQESLSVSGILLGKTMGRSDDLADAVLGRVAAPGRPRGAEPDDGPLDDGRDPDDVRRDAGARLLVRGLVAAAWQRDRHRHAGGIHDPADPAVLPDRQPARRPDRGAELAGAVRPDLRLPRPADRHRRGHPDARASSRGRRLRPRLLPLRRGRLDAEGRLVLVPAGTKTALVGETGSGKTTCGYLVARLYDASEGTVSIDGIDVRELTFASLAAAVGVVSQETYLFHSTVRENLRFAKPDATDAEVEEAARAAQIHELIASLPDGYETVVGERGYRFSGGEKQRMAIARTVLRNPPILVLDEATSALDTQTERLVQEALERLAEGRTTIAIAHRLSTVRDSDQIVVLDKGHVAETGRHEELLAAGGRYASSSPGIPTSMRSPAAPSPESPDRAAGRGRPPSLVGRGLT